MLTLQNMKGGHRTLIDSVCNVNTEIAQLFQDVVSLLKKYCWSEVPVCSFSYALYCS